MRSKYWVVRSPWDGTDMMVRESEVAPEMSFFGNGWYYTREELEEIGYVFVRILDLAKLCQDEE